MDITKLEADFRIVTPLFMGGADPTVPELRVSGIKGALRFWWRALAYGWHKGNLKDIKEEEGQIFGSITHGQSRIIMELICKDIMPTTVDFFDKQYGLKYLGYGLAEEDSKINAKKFKRKDKIRGYFESPLNATLRISLRSKDDREEIPDDVLSERTIQALKAMGLLGGLGSRSRRGYGSFNLIELKKEGKMIFSLPADLKELKEQIRALFIGISNHHELPKYTAFSPETSVYILHGNKDPLSLLNSVGRQMQQYRVGSRFSPSKFKSDTDLAKKALSSRVEEYPRRVFFGLPHNYHFPKLGQTLDVKPASPDEKKSYERRASPLLFHIQELKDGSYVAVASLIPAKFLPDSCMIQMKRQKKKDESDHDIIIESLIPMSADDATSFNLIKDFLDSDSKWEKVVPA